MLRISDSRRFHFLLVLVLIVFLWGGIYGLNFGAHWDETSAKFDSVQQTVRTGWFWQGAAGIDNDNYRYNYGGVNYLLTWTGFTPEIIRFLRHGPRTQEQFSAALTPIIYSVRARIRVRSVYLVLCSLSILWLYLLNLVLGRSRIESLLAAAILAGSWEFAYHSRWVAPDALMMQFALLCFLLLFVGRKSKQIHWFYAGAIAIGLTMGTKYPGGLVLPFFLVGAGQALWQQTRSAMTVVKHGFAWCFTAGMVFILTTPGVLLDPFRFYSELRDEQITYATGWYGYTVVPGFAHFFLIAKYLSLQFFSHYWPVSIVFTAFCILGFVLLVREKPKMFGLLATGFVVLYLAYFSHQATMIVRNLLVVVPFLCIAAARGIAGLAERWGSKTRVGIYGGIAVLLVVNFGWEMFTAAQIKRRDHFEYFLTSFEKHVQNSGHDTFFVSAKLLAAIREYPHDSLPTNLVTDPAMPHTKVAFLQSEGPDLDQFATVWPANWWDMYETTFGAQEVNLNSYPTFVGNERILVLTARHFHDLPIKESDLVIP